MNIKLSYLSPEEIKELLPENLIHLGFRGSIAHGMYVPQEDPNSIDDKDILGVYVGPLEHYLGFGRQEVKERFIGHWDAVSYELRKFVSLLLKGNPNVLSMLWLPERHIIEETHLGRRLRDNKDIFVSKAAYHSFSGYAWGQFKRMTHYKFEGYMGEKRKQLVDKFGYDTKNAAHLIRLLKMGIEFLTDGELYVDRSGRDNEELLSIKRGERTLEEVKERAERLFVLAEEAYVRSSLPKQPDKKAAEELLLDMVAEFHQLD